MFYGQFSKIRVAFRVLFLRVPCYIGDPKRNPDLENYSYRPLITKPISSSSLESLWKVSVSVGPTQGSAGRSIDQRLGLLVFGV